MEIKKILEILLKRKWVAIQAFLVIVLVAVAVTFLMKPVYEASSNLLVQEPGSGSSALSELGLSQFESYLFPRSDETETYLALMRASDVLETVITSLQLRDDAGELLTPQKLVTAGPLAMVFPRPILSVKRLGSTRMVSIVASSTSPEEAAAMANATAEVFINMRRKHITRELSKGHTFVDSQLEKVKAGYEGVLGELAEFRKKNFEDLALVPEEQLKLAAQKLIELQQQLEDNLIDIAEIDAELKTIAEQYRPKDSDVPSADLYESRVIEDVYSELVRDELELGKSVRELTPQHPKVLLLKDSIDLLRKRLQKEVDLYRHSSPRISELKRKLAALEVHKVEVEKRLKDYRNLLAQLPDVAKDLALLELKVSTRKALYAALVEYQSKVRLAKEMALSDVTVVQKAEIPEKPQIPNKRLNFAVAIFLGILVGAGLAFLIEYLDDTVSTPDDLEHVGDVVFLGAIPKFSTARGNLLSTRPRTDSVFEAYRTVRNSLKFASLDSPLKSIVVTSSIESEGKSLTAANLGISLAHEGGRVIIVDADLRKPMVHTLFAVPNDIGVTSVLLGQVELPDAIVETEVEQLNVLPSGPIPSDPAKAVESRKMKELVDRLGEEYEYVLLDTPPLLYVNDALITASTTDGTVVVAESERVTRHAAASSLEMLADAKANVVGIVLNKLRSRSGKHYYYYHHYHRYYHHKD